MLSGTTRFMPTPSRRPSSTSTTIAPNGPPVPASTLRAASSMASPMRSWSSASGRLQSTTSQTQSGRTPESKALNEVPPSKASRLREGYVQTFARRQGTAEGSYSNGSGGSGSSGGISGSGSGGSTVSGTVCVTVGRSTSTSGFSSTFSAGSAATGLSRRARVSKADGCLTGSASVEGERRDSNPRPPGPQPAARDPAALNLALQSEISSVRSPQFRSNWYHGWYHGSDL